MISKRIKIFLMFSIGYYLGSSVIHQFIYVIILQLSSDKAEELSDISNYDQQLADELYHKVKILCMIMTNPANHKIKAIHVKNTWGKRCNKLLFITTEPDLELDTIALPLNESRRALRKKVKGSFLYAFKHHLNDFDWFMKADDDNFVLMENLRYMLSQYDPKVSLFLGHRFISNPSADEDLNKMDEEGYMAGGGYILSRKALSKFANLVSKTDMFDGDGDCEDIRMGRILSHSAIFVDCRDELQQRRFFPVSFVAYLEHLYQPNHQWFYNYTYYNVTIGSLRCCSDVPIVFHTIKPPRMYYMEYFNYGIHPFGVDKNSSENLPRKLELEEIITASDKKVLTPNFRDHVDYHNMTSSEME